MPFAGVPFGQKKLFLFYFHGHIELNCRHNKTYLITNWGTRAFTNFNIFVLQTRLGSYHRYLHQSETHPQKPSVHSNYISNKSTSLLVANLHEDISNPCLITRCISIVKETPKEVHTSATA